MLLGQLLRSISTDLSATIKHSLLDCVLDGNLLMEIYFQSFIFWRLKDNKKHQQIHCEPPRILMQNSWPEQFYSLRVKFSCAPKFMTHCHLITKPVLQQSFPVYKYTILWQTFISGCVLHRFFNLKKLCYKTCIGNS